MTGLLDGALCLTEGSSSEPFRRHRSLTLSEEEEEEEEEGLLAGFLWLGGLEWHEDPGEPLSEKTKQKNQQVVCMGAMLSLVIFNLLLCCL